MQKPRSKVILKSSCWQDDLIRMFLQEMHAVQCVISISDGKIQPNVIWVAKHAGSTLNQIQILCSDSECTYLIIFKQ